MKPQSISPTSAEVSQPHSQHHVGQQQDSFGNRTAHIADHSLDGQFPRRSWGDVFRETSRKIGLGTAMMGAGLGLGGVAGVGEKTAEAGIISSFGNDADVRARGATYSVEGGGNVAALRMQSDTQTVYSSLVFVNPYTAISAAHQYEAAFGPNQSFSVHTGANYNSGNVHIPSAIHIHPGYTGNGTGIDFAVLKFSTPVQLAQNILFAQSRPAGSESIWMTGYGRSGTPTTGYQLQDGFIRAGESRAQLSLPLLGGDPQFYQNAIFTDRITLPTHLRLAYGDSGGGIFNQNRELVGLGWAAENSIDGRLSAFLNVLAPEVQGFLATHSSEVPEPSSLALSVIAIGAAARRRTRTS